MEQHPVPQHIASFEFKLFGNLTVRQFVTLAIPMAVAALFFFSNLPPFLRFALAGIFAGVGLFASLVPIQGRPLDKWIVLFIKAIMAPTQRIWVKDARLPEFLDIVVSETPVSERVVEPITGQDKARLREYLRSLPRGRVSPFDVKEQIAIARLNLSTEGAGIGRLPPAVVWAGEKQASSAGFGAALPQVMVTSSVSGGMMEAGMPVASEQYQGAMAEALPAIKIHPSRSKVSAHAVPYALPGLEKRLRNIEELKHQTIEPKVQLASDTNFTIENVIPIATPGRRVKLVHGVAKSRARKLHFAPPAGFDLNNLPIRGEARFEVSENLKNRLTPQFYEEKQKPLPVFQKSASEPEVKKSAVGPFDIPGVRITRLSGASAEVHKATSKPPLAPEAESATKPELSDSRLKVSAEPLAEAARPAEILTKAQIVPLTNKPNVLSGIVVDGFGAPVVGAIITVRDENGVPVRALKTNKLGQFLSATPLVDGKYRLNVDTSDAFFDSLELSMSGEVLEPLLIKAKGGVGGQ